MKFVNNHAIHFERMNRQTKYCYLSWAYHVLAAVLVACTGLADNLHGVISSVHPLATKLGLNVLKSGGNAIDAAVAVGLTLGIPSSARPVRWPVVFPENLRRSNTRYARTAKRR